MRLIELENTFAIVRLDPSGSGFRFADYETFFSVTKTADEISVVCREADVRKIPFIHKAKVESGFRGIKISGTLSFSETGILLSLLKPLGEEKIPVFVISTFDTDYIFVKEADIKSALSILSDNGHEIDKKAGDYST
jgi:hypothetical protein